METVALCLVLAKWTGITSCLLSALSSSAVKTCADDDVDLEDISRKYWVVTIRINLPKISLRAWPFQYTVLLVFTVNFTL